MDEREIYKELQELRGQLDDGCTDEVDIKITTIQEIDNTYHFCDWIVTDVDVDAMVIECDFEDLRCYYKFDDSYPYEKITFEYNKILKEWECSDYFTKGFLTKREAYKWYTITSVNHYDEQITKVEKWKAEKIKEFENRWGSLNK